MGAHKQAEPIGCWLWCEYGALVIGMVRCCGGCCDWQSFVHVVAKSAVGVIACSAPASRPVASQHAWIFPKLQLSHLLNALQAVHRCYWLVLELRSLDRGFWLQGCHCEYSA